MLRTLAGLAQSVNWASPQTAQAIAGMYTRLTQGSPKAQEKGVMEQRIADLESLTAKMRQAVPDPWTSSMPAPADSPASGVNRVNLDQAVDELRVTGQSLDEALRFARKDGLKHPESLRRLSRAQEKLTGLERETLRPEVLAGLPAGQRAWAEHVMDDIRTARQLVHNEVDGSPATVASLTRAADAVGRVQTKLRVARITGWAPPIAAGAAPGTSPPAEEGPAPYSRYAPDMAVATGCLPCGRAHLSAAAAMGDNTLAMLQNHGLADPSVQEHVQLVSEELEGLWQDDWTPAKIAASPPDEQAILQATIPALRAAHTQLEAARTPVELETALREIRDIRERFFAMDQGGQGGTRAPIPLPEVASAAYITGHEPTGLSRHHRLEPRPWIGYVGPTQETEETTSAPADPAVAFGDLIRALGDRGVKVRFRNLPSTPEGTLEGEYVFDTNTILLSAATLAKDPYGVQVLAHEAAHALEDNPACHTYNAEVPYEERTEERMASDASFIALVEAGLPIELSDGSVVEGSDRRVDYDSLRAGLSTEDYARIVWTSAWIADALRSEPRDYAAVTCPPTSLPLKVGRGAAADVANPYASPPVALKPLAEGVGEVALGTAIPAIVPLEVAFNAAAAPPPAH